MRENVYAGYSKLHNKNDARNRGPSPISEAAADWLGKAPSKVAAGQVCALPLPNAPGAVTLVHEIWAYQLGSWNQYCTNALSLARPFYVFPFELMQQYFSFICGWPQSVSGPVGQKQPQPLPGGRRNDCCPWHSEDRTRDGDGQCESSQKAMDIATGESTEMWVNLFRVDTPLQQQERQRGRKPQPHEQGRALASAA
jgi:hypothetical protein